MTTYTIARTREELDGPFSVKTENDYFGLPETMTDLIDAQWEYPGPSDLPLGEPVQGQISARERGSTKRVRMTVWVRADADWRTPLNEARDRLAKAEDERAQQLAARDEAIRAALDAGQPVALVAYEAGVSRERVYQIRDGRR